MTGRDRGRKVAKAKTRSSRMRVLMSHAVASSGRRP